MAYLSVDTDVDSAAWKKAQALLDRFPGKDKILSHLRSSLEDEGLDWETDVKPALGNETEAVFLDTDGEHVVGADEAEEPGEVRRPARQEHAADGERAGRRLDGLRGEAGAPRRVRPGAERQRLPERRLCLQRRVGPLPSDSIARAWARGSTVQTAFDRHLRAAGLPAGATESQVGTLDALTAAVTPQADGIKIASTFSGDLELGGSYHADLPGALPGGAVVYLSFNGVGDRINKLVDSLGDSISNFDRDRAQIELVLGYPLEDVFGLLDGEGAIALYPTESGSPAVLFVAQVSDESKAASILDRLATPGRGERKPGRPLGPGRLGRGEGDRRLRDVGLRRRLRREARDDEQPLRAREDAGERAEAGRRLRIQDGCGPSGGARRRRAASSTPIPRKRSSTRSRTRRRSGRRSRRSPRKTPRRSGACSCTDRRTGAI